MQHLDFFYDLSSPWTYLAFNNVQQVLEDTGATVRWKPFLVGGVFNAVNPGVYEARAHPETDSSSKYILETSEASSGDKPCVFGKCTSTYNQDFVSLSIRTETPPKVDLHDPSCFHNQTEPQAKTAAE